MRRYNFRQVLATLILLGLAIYLFDVLLLFFAAALLAVVFRAPSEWLSRHTGLDVRISLGIVLVLIAGFLALSAWLVGHTIAEQTEGVWKRLPQAIDELRGRASEIAVVGPAVESHRAEAERAYALAEQLGSINATAAELGPAGRC